MNNSHSLDKNKPTSLTKPIHESQRNERLTDIINVLTHYGCTIVPTAKSDSEGQVLYVNHCPVLVRTAHTPNDCVGIELFHEGQRNKWVKSWGLTSRAAWLLHVDILGAHYWYKLDALRKYVTDSVTNNTLELRNNSVHTRTINGPSSNVMTVWVNKTDQADYIHLLNATHLGYKRFLLDCVRGEYNE
jgi:hypothetical protein